MFNGAGQLVWGPETHIVNPSAGRFVAVIGSTNLDSSPANGIPDLDEIDAMNLELEVSIGESSGSLTVLSPRQKIFASHHAARAQTVVDGAITTDKIRDRAVTAAKLADPPLPVGSVLSFFGDPASLPAQWVPCDGRVIQDPDSPYFNQPVPDLRQTFLRGADEFNPVGTTGGTDSIASHSHSFSGSGSAFISPRQLGGWTGHTKARQATSFYPNIYSLTVDNSVPLADQDTHGHFGSASMFGTTFAAGASDNRPRFMSLLFIIRVK
jgi:hypothetical protein